MLYTTSVTHTVKSCAVKTGNYFVFANKILATSLFCTFVLFSWPWPAFFICNHLWRRCSRATENQICRSEIPWSLHLWSHLSNLKCDFFSLLPFCYTSLTIEDLNMYFTLYVVAQTSHQSTYGITSGTLFMTSLKQLRNVSSSVAWTVPNHWDHLSRLLKCLYDSDMLVMMSGFAMNTPGKGIQPFILPNWW